MIGLAFSFVGGRYHATPWGAHVNEAAVEWPPSPWRLLRALVSSWHRTAPELDAGAVRDVLDVLAEPPRYRLPEAAPAHTRHYMPDGAHQREVRLSQNLVFDAFLRLDPDEPLLALWDAGLTSDQAAVLRRLAAGVTHLGRSESWCDVEVVEEGDGDVTLVGERLRDDHEVVRLLGVTRPIDLRVLEVSTAELQGGREKRRDPPGTCWHRYERPRALARRQWPRRRERAVVAHAVLWALEGRPSPLLVQVEDVVKAARARIPLRQTNETGRIHLLAYPSDPCARPVRIDRLLLWAERGMDSRELDRACGLGPFRVPGVGSAQVPLLLRHGHAAEIGGPVLGRSRRWRSVTPLVAWRSVLVASNPAERIAELVDRKGVRVVGPAEGAVRWVEFRQGGATGAVLEFPEPVPGPVVACGQRPGFGLFLGEP